MSKLAKLRNKKCIEGDVPMPHSPVDGKVAEVLVEGQSEEHGMSGKLLIESGMTTLQLVESKSDGRMVARGEFGRIGVPTQNGRIYPGSLMEREIKRLGEDLSRRRVLGELDHPSDGKTSLHRVSHLITGLEIKDGVVIGEAEILNTPAGQTLKALIEAQVQIGVSSRGLGSTKPVSEKGVQGEMVQEDFMLKTYDFVYDPAVRTAYPDIFTEDVDDSTAADMFLAEFPEIAEGLVERAKVDAVDRAKGKAEKSIDEAIAATERRIRKEMTEQFEKQVVTQIVEAKQSIAEDLKESYESDPDVAGAKAVLAHVADMIAPYRNEVSEDAAREALKAKDIEVSEARAERDEATARAQKAAYMLYVERKAGGHPMIETIRNVVLDGKCESLDELKKRLNTMLAELPSPVDEESEAVSEAIEARDEAEERASLLQKEVDEIRRKLKRAVEIGEGLEEERASASARLAESEERIESLEEDLNQAEIAVHARDKVGALTNGRALLPILEGLTSKGEVDKVIEEQGIDEMSDGEMSRVRNMVSRGVVSRQRELEEELSSAGRRELSEENIFGVSVAEARQLAGIS